MGFLGWILDQKEALSKEELIPLIFEYRVQAIWLSFGTRLGSWIEYVRSLTQKTGHNIQLFVQVSSLDEAQTAIKEWKADVIVAQGSFVRLFNLLISHSTYPSIIVPPSIRRMNE